MPKVERQDIDDLNAVLTVTLEKSEYEPKFKTELNKYRKQANMKGFRKGKTPLSMLKKMYGQSVLADVINEMLQQELYNYLEEQDIRILGQPLPSEDQKQQAFDVKNLEDYEFKFDLGITPDFEVQGADESTTVEKMVIEIPRETLEEDLQSARKRHGEREAVEDDTIKDNDMVKFKAVEVENGAPKPEGIETEFSILISDNTDEALKEELKSKKHGDTTTLMMSKIEQGRDEEYIRKYYLNLEEGDEREFSDTFEAEIIEVTRIAPAELNQEFFDKAFGEDQVHSEEEALEFIREQTAKFYDNQAEALASRQIQDKLLEQNPMEFPEAFLKRWMKATNENANEETVEQEFDQFRGNLQWSLIRNRLVETFGIEIDQNDIMEAARRRIRNYFGGQSMPGMEQIVDSTAARLLQDQEQVEQLSQEVLTDRVFEVLLEKVNIEEKKVTLEEFEAEVQRVQAKLQAEQAVPAAEEEE